MKGYLEMREAKLMEELWSKEKDLERKVHEYTHHRTSERNSVNLQVPCHRLVPAPDGILAGWSRY